MPRLNQMRCNFLEKVWDNGKGNKAVRPLKREQAIKLGQDVLKELRFLLEHSDDPVYELARLLFDGGRNESMYKINIFLLQKKPPEALD